MAKAIIEIFGVDVVEEEHLLKQICSGKKAIYHESDVIVKWIDDAGFECIVDGWLKDQPQNPTCNADSKNKRCPKDASWNARGEMCGEVSPRPYLVCSRNKGHKGKHHNHSEEECKKIW